MKMFSMLLVTLVGFMPCQEAQIKSVSKDILKPDTILVTFPPEMSRPEPVVDGKVLPVLDSGTGWFSFRYEVDEKDHSFGLLIYVDTVRCYRRSVIFEKRVTFKACT